MRYGGLNRLPKVFAFVSRPADSPALTLCIGSLASNAICGVTTDYMGRQQGTYTAEGITKLCEGLKESFVTSLECAAAPRVFAFMSAPADTAATPLLSLSWVGDSIDHGLLLSYHPRSCVAHPTPVWPPCRSLRFNDLNDEAKQAVTDAADSGVQIEF